MPSINKKSRILETYALILIDTVCLVVSYIAALFIRFMSAQEAFSQVHYTVGAFLLVIALLYSIMSEWNRGFFKRGSYVELVAVLKYNIVLSLAIATIVFLAGYGIYFSRLVFLIFAVINTILTYISHLFFKHFMSTYYKRGRGSDKVLAVTEMRYVNPIAESLVGHGDWYYNLSYIAIVDLELVEEEKRPSSVCGIPVIAGGKDLMEAATQTAIDAVFMYLPTTPALEARDIIASFEDMGIVCHFSMDIPEMNLSGKMAGEFAGYPVLTFTLQYLDYRRVIIKRMFDIVFGLLGLLFTLIITPFVALCIKIDSKGPVIFKQERIGKNGRRFKILKFRSMYIDAEQRKKELMADNQMNGLMFKIDDDPRITRVGKVIRKLSIDELPQFWNVLKGDMSMVGTRPPTVDEFEKYSVHYRRRLSITPGLTGLWQVSGRNDIKDFDEVVKLDLEYIENWSLSLDCKIILQTVGVVLFGRGAK